MDPFEPKKKKSGYRRHDAPLPPLVYTAPLYDATTGEYAEVTMTAKHLKGHEYWALDDLVVGEIDARKDSGARELEQRRIKLKAVLLKLEGVDDLEDFAGDLDRYLDARGNENLVWVGWGAYVGALNAPHLFRGALGGSKEGGVRGADPQEDTAASRAEVPGVSGA